MKKLEVWFKRGRFTGEMIGVAEFKGERTLILAHETISQIQENIKAIGA